MKILLVQLSDIHLKVNTDVIDYFDKIGNAVCSFDMKDTHLIFLFSGDIAFSGKEEEYVLAQLYIDELITKIKERGGLTPQLIFVPGNHDCDFGNSDNDARDLIVEKITDKGYDEIKNSLIKFCLKAQINYSKFENKNMQHDSQYLDGLIKKVKIPLGEKVIHFICFNSAWISRLHEQEGKLFFPIKKVNEDELSLSGDLVISVLHHPYPWFTTVNRTELKKFLEKNSDIILTGHEHIESKEILINFTEKTTEYITGDVLFDSNGSITSGFNIIEIDLQNQFQKISNYKWEGDIYARHNSTEWFSYKRNLSLSKKHFELTSQFENFISDVGAKFYHPIKEPLLLSDIFIYPAIKEVLKTKGPKEFNNTLSSQSILLDSKEKKLILFGAEKSGKTALCKTLYSEFYDKGFLPIYIIGEEIKSATLAEFDSLLQRCIKNQYSFNKMDYIIQLKDDEKIVIIDDFNKTSLNPRYQHRLLLNLCTKYPSIIITVNSFFPIQEILGKEEGAEPLLKHFKLYQLADFGHQLRHNLIEKWLRLGREPFIQEPELIKKTDKTKKLIDRIIGKNLVPSRPFYLLVILQTTETGQPHNLKESSYGHYYQYLITQSLSKKIRQHDEIEAFFSYLAELAYYFYQNNYKEIDRETLIKFHDWYCKVEYKISQSFELLINLDLLFEILSESAIIEKVGSLIKFKYSYIYYFFVAKYFASNLSEGKIKDEVVRLLGMLYVEEYANIIIFLTHHSKEDFIINGILQQAKKIFNSYSPLRFDEDIKDFNDKITELPKMVLQEADVRSTREKLMEIVDSIEEDQESISDDETLPKSPPDELDSFMELNLCFKYIEVMGQLLKNYHGSLNAKSRHALGLEAYKLGMRALMFLFSSLTEDLDALVKEVSDIIESEDPIDDDERENLSKKIIFSLLFFVSMVFIKKVSTSLGHEKLSETFIDILKSEPLNSFRFIDLSIKLDFYKDFPYTDLKSLQKLFEKKGLQYTILQRLVIEHLYMFYTSFDDKQRICSLLGISIADQRLIDLEHKDKM
jgi:hypothetical protein